MLGLFPFSPLRAISNAIEYFSQPISLDTKLELARQNLASLPSGLLLLFADENFNLKNNNPAYIPLPEEVKWQLFHAAKASKDKDTDVIYLGGDFGYEHLSHEHFAILLRILTSYCAFEKMAKGPKNAIFHKHVLLLESKLETLCWENPMEGYLGLEALKRIGDPILAPMILKLEKILKTAGYFPLPDVFLKNPFIAGLFETKNEKELRKLLETWGAGPLLTQVVKNYGAFLKWMKTIGEIETNENDPIVKRAILRWKSDVQERVYKKHEVLLKQLTDAYPKRFNNVFAKENHFAILQDGMRILLERFQAKGSLVGNVIYCSSYDDYKKKLADLALLPPGEWFFSIRCEHKSPYEFGVHQSGAFIEKFDGLYYVQVLDSGGLMPKNGPAKVAEITKSVFPFAKVYSTMGIRQKDNMNCSVFMAYDMKAISRNKWANIKWFREHSLNIVDFIRLHYGEIAVAAWMKEASESTRQTYVTFDVPFELKLPTQSLSQLQKTHKVPIGPTSPQSVAKLKKSIQSYKVVDLAEDSSNFGNDVTCHLKLKAMKYRLYIASQLFQ